VTTDIVRKGPGYVSCVCVSLPRVSVLDLKTVVTRRGQWFVDVDAIFIVDSRVRPRRRRCTRDDLVRSGTKTLATGGRRCTFTERATGHTNADEIITETTRPAEHYAGVFGFTRANESVANLEGEGTAVATGPFYSSKIVGKPA